jgi:hypothetical protein
LLDRNAESNRRAEQKRKGKEKEQKVQLLNASNSDTAFHYKDWVAPLMGDSNEMTA